MEGHGSSRMVKKGHKWPFSITRLTFQVSKVIGGLGRWAGWWPVGL